MFQALVILVLLNFAACGRSNKAKEADEAKKSADGQTQQSAFQENSLEAQSFLQRIEKTWVSECHLTSDDTSGLYGVVTTTFTKNEMIIVMAIFKDAACSQGYITNTFRGGYHLIDTAKNHAGGYTISSSIKKKEYTVLDSGLIALYNDLHFCEISDWKLDEQKDITLKTCGVSDIGNVTKNVVVLKDNQLLIFASDSAAKPSSTMVSK